MRDLQQRDGRLPGRIRQPGAAWPPLIRGFAAFACMGALILTMAGCGGNSGEADQGDQGMPDEVRALLAAFPPVRVDPPLLDFGEVLLNDPVTKTVKLINEADKPIRVLSTRSNCGCTTPSVENVVIAANGTYELPVHFDAEGRVGNRSATVTVMFEGYDRAITFNINAVVRPG